jgi:hypothetical protein
MTIVDKAKRSAVASKIERKITPDTVKLALAWGRGEVNLTQCGRALNVKPNALYSLFAVAFKMAIQQGKLK